MEDDKKSNADSPDFGLNEHHHSILKSYIQFTRYLRQQNLKSVDLSFQDVIDSRLLESTYTQSEVNQLLQNLRQLVTLDIENELINVSHINCLLLKQLFSQAEKWYLYLNIDLSEIQNKHLLEVVKRFDTTSVDTIPNLAEIKTHKLAPLDQIQLGKISEILQTEIETLKANNETLAAHNDELREENSTLREQRQLLNAIVDEKDAKIASMEETQEVEESGEGSVSQREVEESGEGSVSQREVDSVLNDFEQVLSEQLSKELEVMRKQISKAQAQLQLAEEELERKFNQTAVYANMQKMIRKKNEQIQALRQCLAQYEAEGDDSIVEDD